MQTKELIWPYDVIPKIIKWFVPVNSMNILAKMSLLLPHTNKINIAVFCEKKIARGSPHWHFAKFKNYQKESIINGTVVWMMGEM